MGSAATMTKPRPSWFVRFIMITFRICFVTLLLTGLGMGVGLFVGILTTVIGGAISHHAIDLTRAYKVFAIPSALVFGSCTLLFQIVKSVREAVSRSTTEASSIDINPKTF
jgi:cytochrome b subunit of formate dehydrogenase